MEAIIKSSKNDSLVSLKLNETISVERQQNSFSFSVGVSLNSCSLVIQEVWLDEDDVELIIKNLEAYINIERDTFDSFPEYSDGILKVKRIDRFGHHLLYFKLVKRLDALKLEGEFEVNQFEIEKLLTFFLSI
jgi:hypothetical protein